jgi:hypothetical protein
MLGVGVHVRSHRRTASSNVAAAEPTGIRTSQSHGGIHSNERIALHSTDTFRGLRGTVSECAGNCARCASPAKWTHHPRAHNNCRRRCAAIGREIRAVWFELGSGRQVDCGGLCGSHSPQSPSRGRAPRLPHRPPPLPPNHPHLHRDLPTSAPGLAHICRADPQQ